MTNDYDYQAVKSLIGYMEKNYMGGDAMPSILNKTFRYCIANTNLAELSFSKIL